MPPMRTRISNYKAAVSYWTDAGKPVRDKQEVEAIYESLCKPCERYNGKSCTLCGCKVNKSAKALLNKIRMATEVCPLGKWGHFPHGQLGELERPTVRHLLYHVCPLNKERDEQEGWRQNIRQLLKRWGVFNGRKVIAIVTGDGMLPVDRVVQEFGGREIEVVVRENDSVLREVVTFRPLLESLEPSACLPLQASLESQCFFFAHTKGNSTEGSRRGATYWRNVMYANLLDRASECMDRLTKFSAVGTHKMVWRDKMPPYPSGLRAGEWMFAGTFFWMRCDAVFTNPSWREIPRDRYGAEAWPSLILAPEEAHSMFQPWQEYRYPTTSPYSPQLYRHYQLEDDPL